MSNYPDDVTESMIDDYYGEGDACCANCKYFTTNQMCAFKEANLRADYSEEEINEMTIKEYAEHCEAFADEYCDAYEWDGHNDTKKYF